MNSEKIVYGASYHGTLFGAEAGTRKPAVLILPDAWGCTQFTLAKAQQTAELGYVALAGDPYGEGYVCTDLDEAGGRATALSTDPERMLAIIGAGFAALRARPEVDGERLAVMGFCMGGMMAINTARAGIDCRAIVSYHGLLNPVVPLAPITARMLVCNGADDPLVTMEDIARFQAEMTAAKADCQFVNYTGAGHSFTRPDASVRPGFGYHAQTDARSWALTTSFLHECFDY